MLSFNDTGHEMLLHIIHSYVDTECKYQLCVIVWPEQYLYNLSRHVINTLKPEPRGLHLADNIFESILRIEFFCFESNFIQVFLSCS